MAFTDDIQSRDTALFPVVTFNLLDGSIHRISIKPFTLDNEYYSPLLLSSPSIKESIDLENRKYKISNVSLKISNVEYNGLRFTDTQIPMNTEVLIHWVSPSCTTLVQGESGSCYLAYKGSLRKITHDEKTCNITLEDISQSSLHKDVPVALLDNKDTVPEKYKLKPIPMVYGTVDRSPVVITHKEAGSEWYQDEVFSYTITIDSLPIEAVIHTDVPHAKSLAENPHGFLYVDTEGSLLRIPYTSKFYSGDYSNQIQAEDVSLGDLETGESASVIIRSQYSSGNVTALNPAGDNYIEAEAVRLPISGSAYLIDLSASDTGGEGDESSLDNINLPFSDAFDGNSSTSIEIDRHFIARVFGLNDYRGMAMAFKIDSIGNSEVDDTKTWLLASIRMSCYSGADCAYYVDNFTAGHYDEDGEFVSERVAILSGSGGDGVSIDNYFINPIDEDGYTSWDIDNNQDSLITNHSQELGFYSKEIYNWDTPNRGDSIRVYDLTMLETDFQGLDMSQDIYGVALYQRMLVNDPISRDLYACVEGRSG